MKLLRIDARFQLPEDFGGTELEAMEMLVKYLREAELKPAIGDVPSAMSQHGWWYNSHLRGFPFTGKLGIFTLKDSQWSKTPPSFESHGVDDIRIK